MSNKTIECVACNKMVSKSAKTCPHCGQKDPATSAKTKIVASLVILFVFFFIVKSMFDTPEAFFGPQTDIQETRAINYNDSWMKSSAFSICKQFVDENLLSPKQTEYASIVNSYITHIDAGKYIVTSYFDSPNKFGVLLRGKFACTIQHNDGADNWDLIEMKIE